MLPPLPPHVQARVDELVAIAPPLSATQERAIQQIFAPVIRDLAEPQIAETPDADA